MEISPHRTTTSGLQRMGASSFQTDTRECSEHGTYMSLCLPVGWSDCPACTAVRMKAEVQRVEAETSQELRMRRAEIPERFTARRLSTYTAHNAGAARALRVAEAYAGDFAAARKAGQGLIFCGGVGTGKTHLAIGIGHQVMALGYSALYLVLMDALRAVKETYRKDSVVSEAAVFAKFTAPDLLILDEVGMQFGSSTEQMILFGIMNSRYNQQKPTIIISNLALAPITEYLGDRVMDRMREGGGRVAVFDWDSYRRAA